MRAESARSKGWFAVWVDLFWVVTLLPLPLPVAATLGAIEALLG